MESGLKSYYVTTGLSIIAYMAESCFAMYVYKNIGILIFLGIIGFAIFGLLLSMKPFTFQYGPDKSR